MVRRLQPVIIHLLHIQEVVLEANDIVLGTYQTRANARQSRDRIITLHFLSAHDRQGVDEGRRGNLPVQSVIFIQSLVNCIKLSVRVRALQITIQEWFFECLIKPQRLRVLLPIGLNRILFIHLFLLGILVAGTPRRLQLPGL